MKRIIILLFLMAPLLTIVGQDRWSLQECLDYAIENNIALKRQQVQSDMLKSDLKASRASLLPNLNFNTSAAVNFGRSVDPATNDITFNQTLANSFNMGTSVTVFNGFAMLNRVSASKYLYLMGLEMNEETKDLMSLDIISAYYELLMARGVVETATRQLEVTEEQLHRVELMVKTGAENKTTLYEMQSQVSNDRLLLTQAVNSALIGHQNLRRLLQLEPGVDFDIEERSVAVSLAGNSMQNADSVFNIAYEILPSINALEYKTMARDKELKAARGEATPEVRLSAGWGTGYFDANMEGVETMPYLDQLKDNNSQGIQATLSIPIFNRWYNIRNIKRAKLSLEDSRLELEDGKNQLYQEVNTACLELAAIHDEYLSALDNTEYSDLAFTAIEKKFQIGMANTTEYSEARKQKFSAEVKLLSTELQYELKKMTIQFFLTGEWNN